MVLKQTVPCKVSRPAALVVLLFALFALPSWSLGQNGDNDEFRVQDAESEFQQEAKQAEEEFVKFVEALERKMEEEMQFLELSFAENIEKLESNKDDKTLQKIARGFHKKMKELRADVASFTERLRFPDQLPATVKYSLPPDKAGDLKALLTRHVKGVKVESKEGNVIVTTTPEKQRQIRSMVSLLQN